MTKLFTLFLVFSQFAFGQNNHSYNISTETAKIKAYVDSINTDTTLIRMQIAKSNKKTQGDTVVYKKNGAVQKIVLIPTVSLFNGAQFTEEYYFRDEKLVHVFRHGFNATRMDACGSIDIKTSLFFYEAALIAMEIQKEPAFGNCYPMNLDENKIWEKATALLRYAKIN